MVLADSGFAPGAGGMRTSGGDADDGTSGGKGVANGYARSVGAPFLRVLLADVIDLPRGAAHGSWAGEDLRRADQLCAG